MSQNLIIAIILFVLAVGAVSQVINVPFLPKFFGPTSAPGTPTPPAPAPSPRGSGTTHTISMNANGFSPAELTIGVGDTVTFVNSDSRTRWPASDIHPTHLLCPGFDALRPMQPGETYSHTFDQARECPMHDHLIPTLKGKITITEPKG